MDNRSLPITATMDAKAPPPLVAEYWFDHTCILDADQFVRTISDIKSKGVRPDLVASIITHYASKWLPELANNPDPAQDEESSPNGVTAMWMKKRFFVETLIGILSAENNNSILPCNFMLRLLRVANMVGAEAKHKGELEKRIAWQLDSASLKEIMIPSFSHTCGTLLDVEMMTRLVKRFLMSLEESSSRSGAALIKVSKLVDSYLAEAAVDSNLTLSEFAELAGALPTHTRATDDGLYRAIDTYLKAHPNMTKQERKLLCRLMDSRKLSPEATVHASQNDRLPVRAVIKVLFSDQIKINQRVDWSGSSVRSPKIVAQGALELPGRCLSKREVMAQEMEIKKMKEDIARLQSRCNSMQAQIDRVMEKKSSSSNKGFFMRWKKQGMTASLRNLSMTDSTVEDLHCHEREGEIGAGKITPMNMKTKLIRGRTTPKLRKSMS
ncbi:hypothetical protein Ancab_011997 [Ancistrocladus abbreviatus]